MHEPPFASVPLPGGRSTEKPRARGLTMMIDWGLPEGRTRDLMALAAPYVDLVKIATGTARLYPPEILAAKLACYAEHGVRPFLGGQFHEYVFAREGPSGLSRFRREARELGFEAIEISDNYVPLSPAERREQIAAAVADGFLVLGEVGAKEEATSAGLLIGQAEDALAAGASLVLFEGAELVEGGRLNESLIADIRGALDAGAMMFELPGPWVSGANPADIHDLKKMLVATMGPDVNLANIVPDEVIETEALRVGLGVVGPKQPT